jgi:hypothetical protein
MIQVSPGFPPVRGFVSQSTPVLSQGFQQLQAEHNVAIFAIFPTLDVDDHSSTATSVIFSRASSAWRTPVA